MVPCLVSPSSSNPSDREFETVECCWSLRFHSLPVSGANLAGPLLKGKDALRKSLFVRTRQKKDGDSDPVLPANMGQAGSGNALYDQNGNVVLYAVLYNSVECGATPAGFPANTIEVKTSWKVLSKADPSTTR